MSAPQTDRSEIKLLASGKFLELNKSFDQKQHDSFVEGALFIYDRLYLRTRSKPAEPTEQKPVKDFIS